MRSSIENDFALGNSGNQKIIWKLDYQSMIQVICGIKISFWIRKVGGSIKNIRSWEQIWHFLRKLINSRNIIKKVKKLGTVSKKIDKQIDEKFKKFSKLMTSNLNVILFMTCMQHQNVVKSLISNVRNCLLVIFILWAYDVMFEHLMIPNLNVIRCIDSSVSAIIVWSLTAMLWIISRTTKWIITLRIYDLWHRNKIARSTNEI